MVFCFLHLPAELRNQIYDFVAPLEEHLHISRSINDLHLHRTLATLSRVCRQIRFEYLPVQRRECKITCEWSNIPKLNEYLEVIYGSGAARLSGPSKINITLRPVGNWYRSQAVDILPLLNLRRLSPQTQIELAASSTSQAYQTPLATQECVALHRLMHHEDPIWLADLRSGRFASVRFLRRISGQRCVDIVFKADRAPPGIPEGLLIQIPDYSIPESMIGLGHLSIGIYTFVEGSGQY